MFIPKNFLIGKNINFTNGAGIRTAETILNKISGDIAEREKEILLNLAEIEQNTEVPEGYIQYVFYGKDREGFQAGKYANGSYGISL